MPKRKSKKSLSESLLGDGYDSDDSNHTNSSMATSSSLAMSRTMSQLSVADVSIESQFEDWIEQLSEKRGSTRESALAKLIRALSTQYLQEIVSPRMEMIVSILRKLLKKDGQESILAAKALSLLWITCGDSPGVFEDTVKNLKECVKNASDEMKAESMSALAMITFLEEIPNATVVELLDYIQSVIEMREIPSELLQAALDAYGLLYLKAVSRPDREEFNVVLDRHMELLDAEELDVRISAGENIALLLEDHEEYIKEVHFTNQNNINEEESFFERYHELVSILNGMTNGSFLLT
jgi:cell division ATPase FtsA